MDKRPAFLLFGGFSGGKFPQYFKEIKKRNLAILVIDEEREQLASQLQLRNALPQHPFHSINTFALLDPYQMQHVLEQVSRWSAEYEIKAVYTLREPYVTVLGKVADLLQLPSPGLRATTVCRDKFLQRLYLPSWSPAFLPLLPGQREQALQGQAISFPAILKPTTRQASSGVQRLACQEMLTQALLRYPDDEVLLLEEYIQGREFSVESIVQNSQIIFNSVTQKHTNEREGHYFVEIAHTVPATNITHLETSHLLQVNKSILRHLNFQDGIAHAEYRIDNTGTIYLMEIAARNPGDGILQLYHLATGTPLEKALIEVALGYTTSYPHTRRFARQVYLTHEPGVVTDIVFTGGQDVHPHWYRETWLRPDLLVSPPDAPPTLKEILLEKNRGEKLGLVTSSNDRLGSCIFDAQTGEELDEYENWALQHIKIYYA